MVGKLGIIKKAQIIKQVKTHAHTEYASYVRKVIKKEN